MRAGGRIGAGFATSQLLPAGPDPTGRVSFANWPGYMDRDRADPTRFPTLEAFTHRTGIAVDYSEPIIGNEYFFSSIGVPLAMGQSPGYDLVVLSDWVIAQFIGLGWARKLSPGAVPHGAGLLPALREGPTSDLLGYSLPWEGGLTGIGYNLAATGRPVINMTDLLTAPDLRGRVTLVEDMRDNMGLIMLDHGHDPADFTNAEFDLAVEELADAVQRRQIRAVTNSYREALGTGEIAACVAWTGDLLRLRRENPDVGFALPHGGMLWSDNMMILAHAQHPDEAERLMDYYYEPDVAARLAAYLLFICPVEGAEKRLGPEHPALVYEPYVFPPPEVMAAGHYFRRLTPVENSVCHEKFSSAIGL